MRESWDALTMRRNDFINTDGFVVSNYKMLCEVGLNRVYYHKGAIYIQKGEERKYRELLQLPGTKKIRLLVKPRLTERLFRLEPRMAKALNDDSFLLSYQGKILYVDIRDGSYRIEHRYRKGMNNPLSFCAFEDRLLYGEYFGNANNEEVCIYERLPQGDWQKAFVFHSGTICHIHKIVFDKYRKCIWILTGDKDSETGIWKADISFSQVECVFSGSQRYRSCFLAPLKNGIIYSTDTPLESNAVYFSKEKENGTFEEPRSIYEMSGPCIYGRVINDEIMVMATSVEPDPSLPIVRYRFSTKLGKGVRDRYCHLVAGNMDREFFELCRFRKDGYGMWLFQFGNLQFPDANSEGSVLCYGQSLKGIDGKTIVVRVPTDNVEK